MSTIRSLRLNIPLIGDIVTQIYGNKLPSKLQALKVLFFNTRSVNLALRESANLVIKEVTVFWEKAKVPTVRKDLCIKKLEKLYADWRAVTKSFGKPSNANSEAEFSLTLGDLFDIGPADANNIENLEIRNFLLDQRKPGRIGYISNIRTLWDDAEENARMYDNEIVQVSKKRRRESGTDLYVEIVTPSNSGLTVSSQGSSNHSVYVPSPDHSSTTSSEAKDTRGTVNIITEKLIATLDKCKVTDRNATALIIAVAQALNVDVNPLIINKTSIRTYRNRYRQLKAEEIKYNFQNIDLSSLVLHWDGKILKNLIDRTMSERLPVIVTNAKTEQLLGVPDLDDGTGESQANGICETLDYWGISDRIKAICCDTAPCNLGPINGAAVLLEAKLGRDLLYLPCRHHIFELVLRCVFDEKMKQSTGPNVPIFKRFQDEWKALDIKDYAIGLENEYVNRVLKDRVNSINDFVDGVLKTKQPRSDYKELLVLTKIFIGKVPPEQVTFKYPGAFHHARWMAKAIYSLIIFLLRKQFKLKPSEEQALSQICTFIVCVYVKAWFTAPDPCKSPAHDLEFLKILYNYKTIDSKVSQICLNKFKNHLWYLSPEASALAFFDTELSYATKQKMVAALNQVEDLDNDPCKKIQIDLKNTDHWYLEGIDKFISPMTLKFFERFEISTGFLKIDPLLWDSNADFQHGLTVVKGIKVVNDTAERSVRVLESYNNILTRNPEQQEFILRVLAEYHKTFTHSTKKTLQKNF